MFSNRVRKFAAALRVPNWRHVLRRHWVAAAEEHVAALRPLGNFRTVVDVGANRGQFALVARWLFPESEIFSFEPLREPAARFRAIFGSDARVNLHEVAIGPKTGNSTIHISKRDDSSSLLSITSRQNTFFPGTAEIGTAVVKVGQLRDFLVEDQIEFPALLKLDVQGFELQALEGCESLLHRFAHVYVECSFVELYAGQALADEVVSWLRERGLKFRGMYNSTNDKEGRVVQADFLFSRD